LNRIIFNGSEKSDLYDEGSSTLRKATNPFWAFFSLHQMSALKVNNYINGNFCPPIENRFIPNVNPADGSIISVIPDSGADDVNAAVASAHSALSHPGWTHATVTTRTRARWLRRIADLIEERLELFAQAESRDTGTPCQSLLCCYFNDAKAFLLKFHPVSARKANFTCAVSGYS
jgi:hypothetical protein